MGYISPRKIHLSCDPTGARRPIIRPQMLGAFCLLAPYADGLQQGISRLILNCPEGFARQWLSSPACVMAWSLFLHGGRPTNPGSPPPAAAALRSPAGSAAP